ncbi:MAG: hypothetical protein KF757_01335 [Phycisphaeraceae bacterium]|nr:hypothetical protein [Phycisphaeraceae bacterium]MCW5761852.1 hypothetical protein [Phycisphaeraceae bacterium]
MPRLTETYTVFSNAAGDSARRVFVSIGRRPSFLARVCMFLVAALVFGVALVVLIPIMLFGVFLLGSLWLYVSIRSLFRRAGDPNGVLDQRRNVRVIERD